MIGHPYQLRRIDLRDFKSVAFASVHLHPLTVVVGANSSGKSTLLQSILAVTQAVRSGTNTAEFPLNGEFVRLGTFDETRNYLADSGRIPMEIGFEIATDAAPLRRTAIDDPPEEERPATIHMEWRAYLNAVADAPAEPSKPGGFAQIEILSIEVGAAAGPSRDSELIPSVSCNVSSMGGTEDRLDKLRIATRRSFSTITATHPISASGRVQDWDSGESSAINAVVLSGGLPERLLRRVGLFDLLAELWWNIAHDVLREHLEEARAAFASAAPITRRNSRSAGKAADDLRDGMRPTAETYASEFTNSAFEIDMDQLERDLYKAFGRQTSQQRKMVARSIAQLGEATFRRRLRTRLKDEPWISEEVLAELSGAAGAALLRSGYQSQTFFESDVRYLGPLREAPHVLYDPGPSKLDLGVRGEYSAAVLHAQANTSVLMPTPDGYGDQRPLDDALNFWLQEFGIAKNAEADDRGRTGIGLSVTPTGIDRPVDLTSVGVGVSQVLPVILLCLLAEPGTLLILEQPELHLHPKLQQDLADFLLACARSGRQLVIETHSEHVVNRLRRRIAGDETDETRELVGLVFAENHDGITSYAPSEVNSYGGLDEDWPAGFLDLGSKESQELVKESLAKRKRESGSTGAR